MIRLIFYLLRTTFAVGTVVLVDDDGILDVLHNQILEEDVPHEGIRRPRP